MSRSGYAYYDDGTLELWRGAVNSAINGKRGQAALRDLLAALDAIPKKELAAESLVTEDGEFCALGVLGAYRGIDMKSIDPDDCDAVAKAFGLAPAMVREIVYENDEVVSDYELKTVEICGPMRPWYPDWGTHRVSVRVPVEKVSERRWGHMRKWVTAQLRNPVEAA